jgi:hypothetical protein
MKWFNQLRKAVAEWLMPTDENLLAPTNASVPEVDVLTEVPPVLAPFTPIAAQPGLNCPECSTKIAITIPMLLSVQPFYCTACFLEISVNQTESAAALNALQKLQGEFQKAEAIVKSSKSI